MPGSILQTFQKGVDVSWVWGGASEYKECVQQKMSRGAAQILFEKHISLPIYVGFSTMQSVLVSHQRAHVFAASTSRTKTCSNEEHAKCLEG